MADAFLHAYGSGKIDEEHRKAKNRLAQRQHRATLRTKLAELEEIKQKFIAIAPSYHLPSQVQDATSPYRGQSFFTKESSSDQHGSQGWMLQPLPTSTLPVQRNPMDTAITYYDDSGPESVQKEDIHRPEIFAMHNGEKQELIAPSAPFDAKRKPRLSPFGETDQQL